MGQQEIVNYLKGHPSRWFTSREIARDLNISLGSVTMSLKKLRKTNIIRFKKTGVRNAYLYAVTVAR